MHFYVPKRNFFVDAKNTQKHYTFGE